MHGLLDGLVLGCDGGLDVLGVLLVQEGVLLFLLLELPYLIIKLGELSLQTFLLLFVQLISCLELYLLLLGFDFQLLVLLLCVMGILNIE